MSQWKGVACGEPCVPGGQCVDAGGCWRVAMRDDDSVRAFFDAIATSRVAQEDELDRIREPKRLLPTP